MTGVGFPARIVQAPLSGRAATVRTVNYFHGGDVVDRCHDGIKYRILGGYLIVNQSPIDWQ